MTRPFELSGPGCGVYTIDPVVAPSSCPHPPVAAGPAITHAKPRKVWLAFACAEHLEHHAPYRNATASSPPTAKSKRCRSGRSARPTTSPSPSP